jgi:hypothetical protein
VTAVRLALVRHGRSAHVHRGWIDRGGFDAWREAYEAAGLHGSEQAPADLVRLAADATLVVASDAPRAVESARLLAPGREITLSPLLRELALPGPDLRRLRLPLAGWALAVGARNLLQTLRSRYPPPSELPRIAEAADWLADLAAHQPFVVAVTHGAMRQQLALHLVRRGWQPHGRRRSLHHWSAWLFRLPATVSTAESRRAQPATLADGRLFSERSAWSAGSSAVLSPPSGATSGPHRSGRSAVRLSRPGST